VKILGRKDEPGRPLLYGTTPYFLEFFGLSSLKDLPTLREFSDLTDESRELFERRMGEPLDFSDLARAFPSEAPPPDEEGLFDDDAEDARLEAELAAARGGLTNDLDADEDAAADDDAALGADTEAAAASDSDSDADDDSDAADADSDDDEDDEDSDDDEDDEDSDDDEDDEDDEDSDAADAADADSDDDEDDDSDDDDDDE
jgi:segregation and condensation protein B